ncbi:hypothetical protein JOC70_002778 [Clostridium pascui]|uniref:hypothetical protein n=1 Tax=Clostridium pascui TaxID=46609 RepID=UPI00195E4BB1|nr:hypothetical protein [Clostridium pascui]MBM7871280.1 hypothetical protein [Clostridium pascui]
MKKFILIGLIVGMVLSFLGCSNSTSKGNINMNYLSTANIKNNTAEEATFTLIDALVSGNEKVLSVINHNKDIFSTKVLLDISEKYFKGKDNDDFAYDFTHVNVSTIIYIEVNTNNSNEPKYVALKMKDENGKYYFDSFVPSNYELVDKEGRNNILSNYILINDIGVKNSTIKELAETFAKALSRGDKETIKKVSSSKIKDNLDEIITQEVYKNMKPYENKPFEVRVFDGVISANIDYDNNVMYDILIVKEGEKYYFDGFFKEEGEETQKDK